MSTASNIQSAVYEALKGDPLVDTDDIVVEVRGEYVLLNGTVPSQVQLSEATTAAERVPGVSTVYNLLDVALPSDVYGNDAALAALANQALSASPAVPAGVTATARKGCITVTGSVSSAAERDAAEKAVAGVGGELGITNEIVVLTRSS